MRSLIICLLAICLTTSAQVPGTAQWTAVHGRGVRHEVVETPSGYQAYATTFAGDGARLERDADLTGNADGLKGSISFWIDFSGGDGVAQYLVYNSSGAFYLQKQADNTLRLEIYGTDVDSKIRIDQDAAKVAAIVAAQGWHWVGISWDNATSGGAARFYIDGVEALEVGARYDQDNVNLDYTKADYGLFSIIGGTSPFAGCVSEFWVSLTSYVDFSDASVRSKFYNAGTPAGDLSTVAIGETTITPIVYLKNPYDSFIVNSGSGGNFTKYGTTALSSCIAP